MNTRKVDKREQHVKKKLTAAILMLLISCIMTVTSTYAWFTLSTAPEVTGIQTTIGGNGNLEIALASTNTWNEKNTAYEYGEERAVGEENVNFSWGNLVGLDVKNGNDNIYGLDKIVLYPSTLNYTSENKDKVDTYAMLGYPDYGADGRIETLSYNTVSGTYDGGGFTGTGNGVRAIGATSELSERVFAYRNALKGITNAMETTADGVSDAIKENGEVLGGIAVKYALDTGDYTLAEMEALADFIVDTQNALKDVEKSIVNIVKTVIASKASQETISDEIFEAAINTFNSIQYSNLNPVFGEDDTLTGVTVQLTDTISFPITDPSVLTLITKYNEINSDLSSALRLTEVAPDNTEAGTYTWDTIVESLKYLMDPENDNSKIGDVKIKELQTMDKTAAIGAVGNVYLKNNGTLPIVLGEGSSIFYDIAELVGSISGAFHMALPDLGFESVNLSINAPLPEGTIPMLQRAHDAVKFLGEPVKGENTNTKTKIDDVYAYALDLFLRTNASNSNLMLQIAPAQRIYDDSSNPDTMGSGSSMTFTSSSMNELEMVSLLENVRIMFLSGEATTDGDILAEGRLDVRTDMYQVSGEGEITANIRLWGDITDSEGKTVKGFIEDEQDTNGQITNKQIIMPMNKGQAHKVIVLVYLDGTTITNADVSSFATSMTGTMNLQFASDAQLKAMDYSGLSYSGLNGTTPDDEQGSEGSEPSQTVQTLATPELSYSDGKLTFKPVDNATAYSYKIDGGQEQTISFNGEDSFVTIEVDLNDGQTVTYTASANGYISSTATYTHSQSE